MIQIKNRLSGSWGNIEDDIFWKFVKTGMYQPLVVETETQLNYFEGMQIILSMRFKVILDPKSKTAGYTVRAEL